MALDEASMIGINDRVVDIAAQAQTTRMCKLILIYTLRK